MARKIYLNISDIAAYIGQNKYDIVTPFERLWKRVDYEYYENGIKKVENMINENNDILLEVSKEKEVLGESLKLKKINKTEYNKEIKMIEEKELNTKSNLEQLNEKISDTLSQSERIEKVLGKKVELKELDNINDKKEELIKNINELTLTEKKKNDMKKEVESFVNKEHGTMREGSGIEMYEKKFGVKLDTSQQYNKKKYPYEIEYKNDWYIGGRVDGLIKDKYIVEVKNRMRCFFNNLRDYENTQIQLYMWLLEMDNSRLVEKYEDKIRVTKVEKDSDYTSRVFEYLGIFIKNFEKFLDDSVLKQRYVESSNEEKQILLKKLYLSEIEKIKKSKEVCDIDD